MYIDIYRYSIYIGENIVLKRKKIITYTHVMLHRFHYKQTDKKVTLYFMISIFFSFYLFMLVPQEITNNIFYRLLLLHAQHDHQILVSNFPFVRYF